MYFWFQTDSYYGLVEFPIKINIQACLKYLNLKLYKVRTLLYTNYFDA